MSFSKENMFTKTCSKTGKPLRMWLRVMMTRLGYMIRTKWMFENMKTWTHIHQDRKPDFGSISNKQFQANKSTELLDNPAMTSLTEQIKKINKSKKEKTKVDYQNMNVGEMDKLVHRLGTTHVGKTYKELWETEGDYCQWVAGKMKDVEDWKPLVHYLQLQVDKLTLKDEKKKTKGKASTDLCESSSMSSDETGWEPVRKEDQGATNPQMENMMNEMVNNLSERLQNLEVAQQNQGAIVQGYPRPNQ